MLWLFGPSGTGKSTFVTTCSELLGEAATAVKSGQLDDYTIASLARARAAVCSELSTRLLKTASLKALVASDPVVGRHPYGRPFPVVFAGKFIWASNSLPPVDQAEGLWRRIVVVPFVTTPAKKNEQIQEEIRRELSGVLNWALDGLERVDVHLADRTSWKLPDAAIDTVDEYREAADTFAAFAKDELVPDPEGVIASREIYRRYSAWAKERGYTPEPLGPVFWREMKAQGLRSDPKPRSINGRLTRVWTGARLAPEVFG
jgi:putative DNA primase/helicase